MSDGRQVVAARWVGSGGTGGRAPKEVWATGAAYEAYIGRWSRLVGRDLLAWLGSPHGTRWLDVGCGTGALSSSILTHASPGDVVGMDPSHRFVAYAREHLPDPRLRLTVGDARRLPYSTAAFDQVVCGLVLNFVAQPKEALAEMGRVVRRGGVVSAYVWDYAGGMALIRHFWDSAVALDPAARELDERRRFALCRPQPLSDLFREAALHDVLVREIDVPTIFRDFDEFWSPFLGGQGPAPGYAMSLDESRRARLREHIRAGLHFEADGSINLIARAWAVRGTR